ncbi:MAG: lysophospholipid acyltransferase family protein, partial [Tannerella sp.]|nr:lysophospholipid acyltransferase family protein [Tannerella sp.]
MIQNTLYFIIFAVTKLFSFLPMQILYAISDMLYVIAYYLVRYRKKVVRINLRNAFPDMQEPDLQSLERRFYRHFTDYIVESIKLVGISAKELVRRSAIRNPEVFYDLQSKGHRCFILMLGHYGNWEWLESMVMTFENRIRINGIYRPLSNKAIDRLFIYLRTRFGSFCIKKNDAFRAMLRMNASDESNMVLFIADQSPSLLNIHYRTQFLNQDTAVFSGAERIARKLKVPVVFADMQQVKRGYYVVDFQLITDTPAATPEFFITEQYTRLMERSILRNPALWLWTHKRWKHK